MNVIIDLDNTLIYSLEPEKITHTAQETWIKKFKVYHMSNDFVIFERPGLQPFLDWLFKNFKVSIWSAGSPSYVEFIAKNIIELKGRKLQYVLNSNNCEVSQKIYGHDNIKKLELLWDRYQLKDFGPFSTLIIDDLGKVIKNNKHNSLRIDRFVAKNDSYNDNELDRIKSRLTTIIKNYKTHINDPEFKLII